MKYGDLLDTLKNLINRSVSQQELTEVIGLKNRSVLSSRISRDYEVEYSTILKVQNHYGIRIVDDECLGFRNEFLPEEGLRVRKVRQALEMSQEEFASLFGASNAYIEAVEAGKNRLSHDCLLKLLNEYDVSANYVLGGLGELFVNKKLLNNPEELNKRIDERFSELVKRYNLPAHDFQAK